MAGVTGTLPLASRIPMPMSSQCTNRTRIPCPDALCSVTDEPLRATLRVAFETEIRPALSRIMREHYAKTGVLDFVDTVMWRGFDAAACAWLLTMESGEVHRIPFSLVPTSPPHWLAPP